MSKLYEVPGDIAKVLRNAGINVITKHYIEDVGAEQREEAERFNVEADRRITEQLDAAVSKRKKRKLREYKRDRLIEVGKHTPEEFNLRGGRRFYGDKAQRILLKRIRPVPRVQLLDLLLSGSKYHGDDTRSKVNSQIGHLLNMGVLQNHNNGGDNE